MAERGRHDQADRAAWEGEMFRLLAENALDYALFIVDLHRHVLSWSKGAERLLGFTEDEIVGQRCDLFFTPEDVGAGQPQRELDEALATGRGDFDRWHLRKDGSRFWSSGMVTPLRDEGGSLRGFAKIMRDRTDLKRSQEALDDALTYAEAIVATVREPLVVLDGDLRVRTANRTFYATFRVRPEDTQGRLLYDLGNGQWDIPALRKILGEILPQNTVFEDFEVEHDFPDIGRKVMLLNARKLYREGNHTELILLAIEDVTALREAVRARQEAETRFTEMVKNVRDHSIFLTDQQGVITSWNVAAERIMGYCEAEVVGRHYSLIFTPEDIAAGVPHEELRQAREQGRAEDERWHLKKDNTQFWALGIVTPLLDPQGGLSGFSKILRDMTEWKKRDEAIRERERQLQLVTDTAPVLIAHCGADLRYKFVNKPYAERFNLHPRDIIGRTVPEVLGAAAFALIRPHVEAALAGQRVEFEADIPYDNSGTQAMRVTYEPERDGSGRAVGLVAAIQNVSDRKRAEERLRTKNERLRLLSEAVALLLQADDTDGMLRGLFATVAPHLGADAYFHYLADGETLRLASCIGLPEGGADRITRLAFGEAVCGTVALNRQPVVATRVQQSNDPRAGFVKSLGVRAYVCNPLMSGDQLLGTLSFASRTKDEFGGDELEFMGTVNRCVTVAYERARLFRELREADRRKDEFLAMLAHELRNPLAPIRNAAQVIRLLSTADPNVQRSSDLIERQVQHLTRLVDDLLDVSRITSGKITLQTEPVELAAVVARAVETARPLIEARGHELAVTLPREALPLDADPTRLAQVVANLLTNAAKYTEERGQIRLAVEREGGTAVVRVQDDGVGIPREMLPRVFDLFTQVDRTLARSEGGLGIGLTLVKSLTEMHGGTVEARSEGPGRGSEFVVRLPVGRTPQIPDGGRPHTADPGRSVPRRVLVVDDNVDAAESLAMLLRLGRHDVRTAQDGPTALQLAGEFGPEIVLLDIGLPRMDGYEVARRLREQPGMYGVLLVALTGYGQEEDRRRSEKAGFDEHLVKPVDPAALDKLFASADARKQKGAKP